MNPEAFDEWINIRLKNRQTHVLEKKAFTIEILPKFSDLYERTEMITSILLLAYSQFIASSGRNHLMLNRSKQDKARERKAEEEKYAQEREIEIDNSRKTLKS